MNLALLSRLIMSALLMAGVVHSASAQSFAALASNDSPARHQRLVDAAKKEGSLTFYTSIPEKDMAILSADFEKRYGVRVIVWRASSVKVLQRLVEETKANRWSFDAVHISSTPELEALYRENVLQEVNSTLQKELMEEAMPAHRGWAPQFLSVFVQAYNTNLIKKENLPKTFADLLDPKWKGQLGMEVKSSEWYCAQVKFLGEEKGSKLFQDIVARNKWSVRSGHSLLANMVASGEVPLSLATYSYMIDQAKQKGAPVDWFAINPLIGRSNGIGISRNPPHPNAALLFYEYMISDAQPLILKMHYLSPVKKLMTPTIRGAKIQFIDPLTDSSETERCDKIFAELNKLKN